MTRRRHHKLFKGVQAKNLDGLSRPLPSSLDGLAVSVAPGAVDVAERVGLIDGMPLILMDDGSYDIHLNRFLRACPGMGARSPNTWRAGHSGLGSLPLRVARRQDGLASRPP